MATTTIPTDKPIPPATADLGTAWPFIEEGIDLIMTNSPTGISYKKSMSLQTVIYNYSSANQTSLDLYDNLSEYLIRRLTGLREIICKKMRFTYLNRHQIEREIEKGKSDIYPVYTLALVRWKAVFLTHLQGTNMRLTTAILRMIERQRSGEAIDEDLVKNVVDSFVALGPDVFQEHIRTPLLERYGDGYGSH